MYYKNRSVSVFYVGMFLLLVIFCFVCQPAFCEGGTHKKTYDSKFDSLWSRNIFVHSLSNDGNWIAVRETYPAKEGIIHIINTQDSTRCRQREGSYLAFSSNSNWIGSISPDTELELCNLKNFAKRIWYGISSFIFSPSGDLFAAERINNDKNNSLIVVNLRNLNVSEIADMCEYMWHPAKDILVISLNDSTGSKIVLYDVATDSNKVISSGKKCLYSRFLWSKSGNTLVYLEENDSATVIHNFNLADSGITSRFVERASPEADYRISIRDLRVSNDGAAVIYSLGNDYFDRKFRSMEVWDASHPWIYPRLRRFNVYERALKTIFWDTTSGLTYEVTDEQTPDAKCNPDYPYALVYDKMIYEPQYKQETDVDLYLKNLRSGDKMLIVSKQYTYHGYIKLSPSRRYVAFFKDYNWWVYDTECQSTTNLTESLDLSFEKTDDSPVIDKEPYGNPGWTENEKYIILYDRYDIWLMTPDGKYKERITQGRERRVRYRICHEVYRNDQNYINRSSDWVSTCYDLTNKTLLRMEGDDYQTGYAVINEKMETETIFSGPGTVEGTLFSEDKNQVVFKSCRFNLPPAICVIDLQTKKKRLLYQSNASLMEFDLGNVELLRFGSGGKTQVSGALIYPANFDQTGTYPMIVYIYERNSGLVNSFSPPSGYDYTGFNILRYVTRGYFVLLPDIEYSIGEPGISALKSVTSLVTKVTDREFIDKNRIGLIGHSFGGFEAAFIATQTKMFRAVVAGSAITDLISWYHDIQGDGWDTEQMWRLENHQLRMGGPYYNHKKQFQKNSPLYNVEKLDTPMLLWVGKNDYNVNWYQSIYFFMAMKRLNKTGKLLLFNDEGHSMVKPENQQKLSEEVFTWFDGYLKEEAVSKGGSLFFSHYTP